MTVARPERILHVAPTPFFSDRGCHIRIRGLVMGLDSLGADNLVCTYGLGNDVPEVETVRCPKIPGYSKTSAGPSFFRFIADPLLVFTVAGRIRKYRPVILHCHLHEGVLIGWLAKYLALKPRLRIVFDVQGGLESELVSYGHLKSSWLRKIVHAIEGFIIRRADAYSCSSEASVALLVDDFGVEPSIVAHVPDGADVSLAGAGDRGDGGGSQPIAIYTGGLSESKGLSMLMEIIRVSAERNPDLRFLIVGYPTDELQAFLDEHQLQNCELAGRIPFEQLGEYLNKADVCIEPKSAETSEASGKLLNYMSSGRPTVCFDTPNNRAIMADSGFFAEQPTAASFVDQLATVIANPAIAAERGARARELIEQQYSWRSSALRIMDRYVELLA